jgi:hypothetical protein
VQDLAVVGGQFGQCAGEPGVADPPLLGDGRPARLSRVQHDLAPVGRVRGALHQAPLLELGDDLRHRRWLHPLVLGKLARGERAGQAEAGERGDLGERQVAQRPGLTHPAVEPHDRVAQHAGERRGRRATPGRLLDHHLVSLPNEQS